MVSVEQREIADDLEHDVGYQKAVRQQQLLEAHLKEENATLMGRMNVAYDYTKGLFGVPKPIEELPNVPDHVKRRVKMDRLTDLPASDEPHYIAPGSDHMISGHVLRDSETGAVVKHYYDGWEEPDPKVDAFGTQDPYDIYALDRFARTMGKPRPLEGPQRISLVDPKSFNQVRTRIDGLPMSLEHPVHRFDTSERPAFVTPALESVMDSMIEKYSKPSLETDVAKYMADALQTKRALVGPRDVDWDAVSDSASGSDSNSMPLSPTIRISSPPRHLRLESMVSGSPIGSLDVGSKVTASTSAAIKSVASPTVKTVTRSATISDETRSPSSEKYRDANGDYDLDLILSDLDAMQRKEERCERARAKLNDDLRKADSASKRRIGQVFALVGGSILLIILVLVLAYELKQTRSSLKDIARTLKST